MFKLPKLSWNINKLAPYISAETIEFHYNKHHAAYINKLNELIKNTEWEKQSLTDIVKKSSGSIYNQAAQSLNHEFYWNSIAPPGTMKPNDKFLNCLKNQNYSINNLKKKFTDIALGHFGSGWIWFCYNTESKTIEIIDTHDAGHPYRKSNNLIPLLTCDVWEHAYYIDYRNVRAKYLEAWWELINWDFCAQNLNKLIL